MDLQMKNANLIERESVYLFSQNYSIISLNKDKPSFNYAYKIGGRHEWGKCVNSIMARDRDNNDNANHGRRVLVVGFASCLDVLEGENRKN